MGLGTSLDLRRWFYGVVIGRACNHERAGLQPLTCSGAGVQVAGAVLDADALAVGAPVGRQRVGALPLGQLHPAAAGPRALPVGCPLGPAAVHLRGCRGMRCCIPSRGSPDLEPSFSSKTSAGCPQNLPRAGRSGAAASLLEK